MLISLYVDLNFIGELHIRMSQSMINVYRKFYDHYKEIYGENTCIFLLVGKFYELYDLVDSNGQPFTSMRRAVQILNIVLKEKPGVGSKGELGLWAGVPEQSLHKYAGVLTREGWTVIVVDQVKDKTDQVIDRVPARILSPGTHIETASQDRMSVAAIWIDKQYSCSIIDLTTGEVFSYTTEKTDDILHMLQVYSIKETIVIQVPPTQELLSLKTAFGIRGIIHEVPYSPRDNLSNPFTREEYLRKMFRLKTMMPVRTALDIQNEGIERSLCSLLRFIEDHFPQQSERLTSHEVYTPTEYMRLSNNILEQLSILTTNGQKSVLQMLERTHSSIGRRAMRERILRPLKNEKEMTSRWNQVAWATEISVEDRRSYERDLKALYDLPRIHYKFAEGSIESIDILQAFQSYSATACLIKNLQGTALSCDPALQESIQEYREKVVSILDEEKAKNRSEGGIIGFLTPISGPETCKIEEEIQTIHESWKTVWESFCKSARISPDSFHLDEKGDGEYTWEGSRTHLKAIEGNIFTKKNVDLPGLLVDHKKTGPIVLSCPAITLYTNSLRAKRRELSLALKKECQAVCDTLWEAVRSFQVDWIEWLGRIDCTLALASAAREYKWVKPTVGGSLEIHGLRHPLLETCQTRMEYVKHSVELGKNSVNGWLLYGVNASGKSSLMKAVGVSVILAQAGSFVPADSMSLRPYDAAFSRIWSHDNLWSGLSSFAVEISELRDILQQATDRSLILGDEVCSGTESVSATALVASTLEHLDTQGCHFIFATHLHDLMKVPGFLPRPGISVWHLRVQRVEGKLVYDRTIQPGSGSPTYGLEVAHAMGIPLNILERAHTIRRSLSGEAAITDAPKSTWNSNIVRHVCEICKCKIVNELEVHHINQRSEGGDNQLRNLVVLCERCHDLHHAGKLDIGPLQMTSEGLERSTVTRETSVAAKWTEEEIETIFSAVARFRGRPLLRACLFLEENGIRITQTQLKKFI